MTLVASVVNSNLGMDLLKIAAGTALTAVLAWFIGTRVTYKWDDARRRREADFASRTEFYRVYGEFFATWKLWDAYKRKGTKAPDDIQWSLLAEASKVEGGFEALLVKVASEHTTDLKTVLLLACFRQAYQALRERIRENRVLEWWATYTPEREHGFREYRAFKAMTEHFAGQLVRDRSLPRLLPLRKSRDSGEEEARRIHNLLGATLRNDDWMLTAERELSLPPVRADAADRAV